MRPCCLPVLFSRFSPETRYEILKSSPLRNSQTFPPSCLFGEAGSRVQEWQHGSCDIFHHSSTVQSGMKQRLFPEGTWPVSEGGLCWPIRGLLKPGSTTCSDPRCFFPLDRQQGRKEAWPGSSSSASGHGEESQSERTPLCDLISNSNQWLY